MRKKRFIDIQSNILKKKKIKPSDVPSSAEELEQYLLEEDMSNNSLYTEPSNKRVPQIRKQDDYEFMTFKLLQDYFENNNSGGLRPFSIKWFEAVTESDKRRADGVIEITQANDEDKFIDTDELEIILEMIEIKSSEEEKEFTLEKIKTSNENSSESVIVTKNRTRKSLGNKQVHAQTQVENEILGQKPEQVMLEIGEDPQKEEESPIVKSQKEIESFHGTSDIPSTDTRNNQDIANKILIEASNGIFTDVVRRIVTTKLYADIDTTGELSQEEKKTKYEEKILGCAWDIFEEFLSADEIRELEEEESVNSNSNISKNLASYEEHNTSKKNIEETLKKTTSSQEIEDEMASEKDTFLSCPTTFESGNSNIASGSPKEAEEADDEMAKEGSAEPIEKRTYFIPEALKKYKKIKVPIIVLCTNFNDVSDLKKEDEDQKMNAEIELLDEPYREAFKEEEEKYFEINDSSSINDSSKEGLEERSNRGPEPKESPKQNTPSREEEKRLSKSSENLLELSLNTNYDEMEEEEGEEERKELDLEEENDKNDENLKTTATTTSKYAKSEPEITIGNETIEFSLHCFRLFEINLPYEKELYDEFVEFERKKITEKANNSAKKREASQRSASISKDLSSFESVPETEDPVVYQTGILVKMVNKTGAQKMELEQEKMSLVQEKMSLVQEKSLMKLMRDLWNNEEIDYEIKKALRKEDFDYLEKEIVSFYGGVNEIYQSMMTKFEMLREDCMKVQEEEEE